MGSTSLLLSPAMTSLVLLLTSSLLMTMVVCKPYNRYEAGRELASLATDNPGASIDLLRQIRRNFRGWPDTSRTTSARSRGTTRSPTRRSDRDSRHHSLPGRARRETERREKTDTTRT